MENQNITTNDEVMTVAEEVLTDSGNGMKFIGGSLLIAGIAGAAYGGYKLIKKLKAKKDSKYSQLPDDEDEEVHDCDEENE